MPNSILVVEDSEADQFLFKLLAEEKYPDMEILQAYDGEEAHELLTQKNIHPDIIFLDINMPRMNGYEFLDIAQQIISERNITLYVLTSSNDETDKSKIQNYPCVCDYLEKPIDFDRLGKALTIKH